MKSESTTAERELATLLQLAYSGELAAAHAYRGHWHSVSDPEERVRIRTIEEEELHHRRMVGEMLQALEIRVSRLREFRASVTGRILGCLCYVAGRLVPMYGAGRLESRNIREYETAARHAWAGQRREWVDCLLTMAEVEWEHEAYFRERVVTHWIGRRLPLWPSPPSKESIRTTFDRDTSADVGAVSDAPLQRTRAVGGRR